MGEGVNRNIVIGRYSYFRGVVTWNLFDHKLIIGNFFINSKTSGGRVIKW